jgi:alcohol dehydrogenase
MTTEKTDAYTIDYRATARVIAGSNSVEQVGTLACSLATGTALLVTDAGLVEAGHAGIVAGLLEASGFKVIVYDEVRENPTTKDVARCVEVASEANISLIVGVGGGSSLDTAKGCNFILTNGGQMQDYWGYGKATLPMLPMIAIPTTGGTGSECQSYALIADDLTHQKMACGDPKAMVKIAILDPLLTLTQPEDVTVATGIDALSHAVESYVTKYRNSISQVYSKEAFRLVVKNFPRVLAKPDDLEARAGMQLAAAYGGMAIENSMLGAAHAAANPLTANFGIVHGKAVGLMLPPIVKYNGATESIRRNYAELAVFSGLAQWTDSSHEALSCLVDKIEELVEESGIPRGLSHYGIDESALDALAQDAARQWTASFNPRKIEEHGFVEIYREVMVERVAIPKEKVVER